MDADIKGCLSAINKSYRAFSHNGKSMTKKEVSAILKFGLSKGYERVSQISDIEINKIINSL